VKNDSFIARAVEALSRAASAEDRQLAQLFVKGWLLCAALLTCTTALYAGCGLWAQAVIQLATIALGAATVWLFARTGRIALCAQLSLGIGSLTFALGSLAQSPPDTSSVAWLGLAPLVASVLQPLRIALRWLVIESLLAVTVVLLGHAGFHLAQRDPLPQVTTAVNLTLMFTVMALFAWSYRRRVELQVRAEAANRAKAAFLATISHELRTPMNGILGMTELLVEDEARPDRREKLRTILRSGHVLVQLVNDILDFTKVESGKLTLLAEDADLEQLAGDLEQLFRPLAAESALELVLALSGPLPRVSVDALRLRQVLSNLIGNALKFTPRGSVRLEVCAGPLAPDGRVPLTFSVADTGVGIRADALPRLLLPFEQGDSSAHRRFGGVGLGLAIARQLVTLLGGELHIETEPGRGSRFWFELRLPLARSAATPTPPSGLPVAAPASAFPVLVVDDNPINLKVASALVARAGFSVVTATNGREALEAVRERRFAAVLMDCHMPEVDGFECSRRIVALGGETAQTPIIAVSASAAPDDIETCRVAGMCDFVAKPLTYSAIVSSLQRNLR
jgi:signal transduction histidine kinase